VSRRVVFLALALTLSCAPSVVRLTPDEYERLPRDYRQEIFDAENDLVIARNRLDEATDRKDAAERSLTDLSQKWQRTSQALSTSGQAAKVPKARKVFDTNVAYTTSIIDVAAAAIRRAEADVRVSRARLYLVRQRELARIGRVTVGSLKPLEDAVKDLETKLKATSAEEIELRTRVQTQLNAWKVAEDEYAASSGDYDTGVWGE